MRKTRQKMIKDPILWWEQMTALYGVPKIITAKPPKPEPPEDPFETVRRYQPQNTADQLIVLNEPSLSSAYVDMMRKSIEETEMLIFSTGTTANTTTITSGTSSMTVEDFVKNIDIDAFFGISSASEDRADDNITEEDIPMGFRASNKRSSPVSSPKGLDYKFQSGAHEGSTVKEVLDDKPNYIQFLMDELDFELDNEAFAYYRKIVPGDNEPLYFIPEDES